MRWFGNNKKTANAEYAYRRVQDGEKRGEKRGEYSKKNLKNFALNTPLNTPIKLNNKHNIIEATNAPDLYHRRTDVSNVVEMATLLKNRFNKIVKIAVTNQRLFNCVASVVATRRNQYA